jgi:peptide/nickel transport system substrate-binding protein
MGEEIKGAAKPKKPVAVLVAILVVAVLVIAALAYVFVIGGGEGQKTIVFYAATNVLSLDPMDAYDTMSFIPIQNIYDTLVGYPGEDIDEYVGVLATSWTVSDDGVYYNFTLREGVKFSNGNDFTAEDVEFSVKRILEMDSPDTGVAWILSQDVGLDSVTVIDDYHVSFELTFPYAGFLATIAQPFPLAIMDKDFTEAHYGDSDPYAHDFMKNNPMGTGPFKLEKWDPNVETILVRNENYWGGWEGEHVDKVIIKEVSEAATRVQALKSGDATIAEIPYGNIPDVEDDPNVVVDPVRTFQLEMIAMNVNTTKSGHEFMTDAGVRRALCFAFDYANTSTLYYAGYMDPVQGPIPNGMPFETEAQPYKEFTFDLAMASELLNDSGYGLNAENLRFEGTAINIYVDEGDTERAQTGSLFKTNLNRLGINVNLQQVTSAVLEDTRKTDDWDMYFTGWVIDYLDPDDYVLPIAVSYDAAGDYFLTGINNPTIDDAALAAAETIDPDERADLYNVVWEELNADPNMIFVGQTKYVCYYRTNLDGFMFNAVTWYNFYHYSLS